ncbi:hypothetical protein [Nodosilinea sp. E11]|uniref:SMODS-associated NUDIX domain-containing protein n=1 Tax=Nodosilinea sp. E11 TaxID=3037479 RepID=UPI00293427A3|nr:hypothetical protein [Nodosilinea sp. E11]WOD40544.1 hypothetical protein RRF56_07030 [Nodosilinea sp. E11]
MTKVILYILLLFLALCSLLVSSNSYFVSVVLGVISSIIILLADLLVVNSEYYKLISVRLLYRDKNIRMSISYLFRIKVEGKYLLIRGKRFPQFQPVGGVFKRYDSSISFFQEIHALDDDLIPIDADSKRDLRIRLKGRYLLKFMKWFDSRKNREICGWREFYEELVKPRIFPEELFPFVKYQFIKRHINPIRYSDFSQSYEILVAEIYEVILDREQESFLQDTIRTGISDCIWVTEEEVLRRGAMPGHDYTLAISEHSRWII